MLPIRVRYPDKGRTRLELWQLEVFVAVADEKGFSRAGDRLGRTQPAISSTIRLLEEELGERLFDRLGKTVRLTEAGEVLADFARRLLRLRGEAVVAVGELRELSRGSLSLGANETTCLYLLPDVLSAFKQAYPQVQVDIHRAISRTITERVIEGSLDFGIVTLPARDQKLQTMTIHDDELTLIVGPEHRLASRRSAQIKELEGEPFILHKVGTRTRERLTKRFSDNGVKIKVAIEMASIETIKRFVSIGMGISIVPRLCISKEVEEGNLRALTVRGARFKRRLGLIHNRDRYLSKAARAFLDLIKEQQTGKREGARGAVKKGGAGRGDP